jgi:hypothetical protein
MLTVQLLIEIWKFSQKDSLLIYDKFWHVYFSKGSYNFKLYLLHLWNTIRATTFHQSVHHVSQIEFSMMIANRVKRIKLKGKFPRASNKNLSNPFIDCFLIKTSAIDRNPIWDNATRHHRKVFFKFTPNHRTSHRKHRYHSIRFNPISILRMATTKTHTVQMQFPFPSLN